VNRVARIATARAAADVPPEAFTAGAGSRDGRYRGRGDERQELRDPARAWAAGRSRAAPGNPGRTPCREEFPGILP